MAKKIDYASMFTLRKDGRYQGYWHDLDADGEPNGPRHTICDRDPEKLYYRIQEKEHPQLKKALTFEDIAEQWKAARWEDLSYKSTEAYAAPFRCLVERFGTREINSIETRDVSAFLTYLANRKYAKRTVQLHRDMMSQIYNAAIGKRLTRYNPCDHAVMPRNLAEGTRGIPPDEAIEAVKSGLDKPFGLFAYICLYAGLRRGELLALRYEDIDRDAKLIHVTKSVEYIGNNPHIKEPKTKSGRRDVIMPDVLAEAIPKGSGYIFAREDGQIITKQTYAEKWKRYCKAIGYNITAHQLRHGYASMLYEAEIPDKDAQEQLGHANITLTRDVYTHISKKQRSKTAAKINKFIDNQTASSDNDEDLDAVVGQILALLEGKDVSLILAKLAANLGKEKT